jgi:hypothetical protein
LMAIRLKSIITSKLADHYQQQVVVAIQRGAGAFLEEAGIQPMHLGKLISHNPIIAAQVRAFIHQVGWCVPTPEREFWNTYL